LQVTLYIAEHWLTADSQLLLTFTCPNWLLLSSKIPVFKQMRKTRVNVTLKVYVYTWTISSKLTQTVQLARKQQWHACHTRYNNLRLQSLNNCGGSLRANHGNGDDSLQ